MTLPLLPLNVSRVPLGLRQALAQEGLPFVDCEQAAQAARFVLFDSRSENAPQLLPGQQAIDVDLVRQREGGDLFADLVDEQSVPRSWSIGGLDILKEGVVEEVARVDKRATRRRILAFVRREIERHLGVWMTVGAYPYPYRSAFNFRFDHDEFVAADFDAVLAALCGWEDAASHYVCGSTHEDQPAALARLRGMDVGSHGYWHHTYCDAADNDHNIRRGIDVLRAAGIEPSGFVAPHGRFNRGLLETLRQLGIGHSSEFALAYDDLPFFPRESDVLQIPVHPVSLGVILEAARRQQPGLDDDPQRIQQVLTLATDYLVSAARAKSSAGEPVFLYCHPNGRLGRYPQVLRAVLEAVASLPTVWKTTYSQFARWWRERARVAPRVEAIEGGYSVVVDHLPAGFEAAIEVWRDDRVAALPLRDSHTRFSPAALSYASRRPETPLPLPQAAPVGRGLRAAVLRRLDWERVTPPREIRVRGVRSLVKKTLRYIKR